MIAIRVSRLSSKAALICLVAFAPVMYAYAGSIVVVSETFDGYTHFPDEKPANDPVNLGVPLVSKGADSDLWLAARFELGDDGPISNDVGVQKVGGGGDNTHVGRAGDDAGLVLRLDLTGLTNVTLDFDWRTFLADTGDRFVVAYYQGDGTVFQAGGLGLPNGDYDWYTDPDLGGGVMDRDGGTGNAWYQDNWTELLRATKHDTFRHENFSLPGGDILYLAFWMDNGDGDFAKFDNIVVMADPVPESSGLALLLTASCLLVLKQRLV
jgi:hypothetical protein